MWDLLLWLYLINATLLINHEIDSAYWKEWELFKLPGEIGGFLLIHLPLIGFFLWGLVLLAKQTEAGIFVSIVLAGSGLFAFTIHTYFQKKGRPEFKAWISRAILVCAAFVSVAQAVLCIYWLTAGPMS